MLKIRKDIYGKYDYIKPYNNTNHRSWGIDTKPSGFALKGLILKADKTTNEVIKFNGSADTSGFKQNQERDIVASYKNKKNQKGFFEQISTLANKNIITPNLMPSKQYAPVTKHWCNSVYSYNKNLVKLLPAADTLVNKIFKNFFTITPLEYNHKETTSNLINKRNKSRSLDQILVSNSEVKHTADTVHITLHVFNKKRNSIIHMLNDAYNDLSFIPNHNYNNKLNKSIKQSKFYGKNLRLYRLLKTRSHKLSIKQFIYRNLFAKSNLIGKILALKSGYGKKHQVKSNAKPIIKTNAKYKINPKYKTKGKTRMFNNGRINAFGNNNILCNLFTRKSIEITSLLDRMRYYKQKGINPYFVSKVYNYSKLNKTLKKKMKPFIALASKVSWFGAKANDRSDRITLGLQGSFNSINLKKILTRYYNSLNKYKIYSALALTNKAKVNHMVNYKINNIINGLKLKIKTDIVVNSLKKLGRISLFNKAKYSKYLNQNRVKYYSNARLTTSMYKLKALCKLFTYYNNIFSKSHNLNRIVKIGNLSSTNNLCIDTMHNTEMQGLKTPNILNQALRIILPLESQWTTRKMLWNLYKLTKKLKVKPYRSYNRNTKLSLQASGEVFENSCVDLGDLNTTDFSDYGVKSTKNIPNNFSHILGISSINPTISIRKIPNGIKTAYKLYSTVSEKKPEFARVGKKHPGTGAKVFTRRVKRKPYLKNTFQKRLSFLKRSTLNRVIKNRNLLETLNKIEEFFKYYEQVISEDNDLNEKDNSKPVESDVNKNLPNSSVISTCNKNGNIVSDTATQLTSIAKSAQISMKNNLIYTYKIKFIKDTLDKEFLYLYYIKMLSLNNIVYKSWFMDPIKNLISNIYNKKVVLNIIDLKYMYLNSDIFTQAIAIKLKDLKKTSLAKILTNALSLVVLSKLNHYSYDVHSPVYKYMENHYNRFKYLNLDLFNNTDKATDKNHKLNKNNITPTALPLNPNLSAVYTPVKIRGLNYNHASTINFIRYKSVFGVRLEVSGRLTKRSTASRSVFKYKYRGNLRNNAYLARTRSSVVFNNAMISNIQYSKISSQTRTGAFGLKGWINNN